MTKLSKSEIKAAISKILARKEVQPPIQFRRLPRPNLGKRLASVFAEAGVDASKLEKIASDEREEFVRLQKKREQYYKKQNAAFEKQYKATLKNKKRALEAIAGQTIGVQTITVHTASTVATHPESILKGKKLEPWNNYVKFFLHDSNDTVGPYSVRYADMSIIFGWVNQSNDNLIVRANADVIVKGFCQTIAQQGLINPAYVSMNLSAGIKAYPGAGGPPVYGSSFRIMEMYAESYADIFGGDGGWTTVDLYEPRNVTLNHLLVNRRSVVIFQVFVYFYYTILNGIAEMEFSDENRYVRVPALILEYGGEPTVVGPG
jgi:hypothetical protein